MIANSDRLWLSFGAGLLAAVNPCGFVLLPTYLMYFLGVSGRPGTQRSTVRRALLVSAALSAGFMTIFIIVGGVSRLFTDWLNQNAKYVSLLIGVALVILGIAMLFGYRLPFSTPKLETGKRDQTVASMYVFGLAYAIASIGCTIGPFSAIVLGTIDTDGFFQGIIAVVLYGVAMSLLITTLTVTLALAQGGLLKSLRVGMTYVEIASAVIMILSGLYLTWYWFNDIRDKYDDDFTGQVLNWQERIVQIIDDNRLILAIVFTVIVGVALTYTLVSRRREIHQGS
ncbi:MAG: cytochrome c biogenesis CcdA family protein [Ilumatobacteraceae bacterium]|jgi:cytochrome c-type biogenesis protein|nr:cytochrome c biogenesis CcdA family protein [Ilumatobacteraceae bacterium]MDP4713361.1 cytochrome c biogenesis CcdA family protein [Ilumatobacteraceae bacterium]MDP4936525.1 cytochrome c biogenesis CcdA family protein [Ilumatobacteraceae bacterium]MDP4977178.1 cytochrome c biogenesis CcdA family protein [Ilumatobacteraceae bacterium]MDP5113890.1 cytochrome c biogenesis CcdA family protein [Ilumatobacteraceae bacterium]